MGVVLLVAVVFFTPTAEAQPTIHALSVIIDEGINNPNDHKKNGSEMELFLRDVAYKVCNLQLTIFQSSKPGNERKPTRDNILKWIREVRPQQNDVVFVYFSGHGGATPNVSNDQTFGGTYLMLGSQSLYRKALVDALKVAHAWQCRLKILITDSCSKKIPPPEFQMEQAVAEGRRSLDHKARVYRQLFVEHEGFLHLASASEGQPAYSDQKKGGWFTYGLLDSIDSYANAPATSTFITWDKVFTDTKKEVERIVRKEKTHERWGFQNPKHYGTLPKRVDLPEVRILKVWLDHDQFEAGVEGMRIHVKFEVDNLKGSAGKVHAHFFQPDGQSLYQANGQLLNFSLSGTFKPGHVNTTYEDFKLFMPNARLRPLGSGKHNLKVVVTISNSALGTIIGTSSGTHFTFTDSMVLVPAGEFQMGSNYLVNKESKPVHTVYLDAFYIDTHEVTVGEYKQFLKAVQGEDYRLPHFANKHSPTDKHPIVDVSWHDAMAYAKWANKWLPTEAEWEKAARGPEQFENYPWEDDETGHSQANYDGTWGEILPVGRFKPNRYGLYDMAGNVAEWCLDPFFDDFYQNSPRKNPFAGFKTRDETIANFESVKGKHVIRGGSWNSPEINIRVFTRNKAAVRNEEGEPQGYTNVGFRCVVD